MRILSTHVLIDQSDVYVVGNFNLRAKEAGQKKYDVTYGLSPSPL